MNAFPIIFLVINAVLLLLLPRRWAPLPFLIGACYVTSGQVMQLGPFNFSVIRILIAVGLVRILLQGERTGRTTGLDRLMLVWSAWMLISSLFHEAPSAALVNRLGLVYDACGIYFLLRVFCQSLDDVVNLCSVTAILLVPVAFEMIYEKLTVTNLFSILGEGSISPAIRDGRIRARGPFAHAILAGTVGAVCLPLMIGIWHQHRKSAAAGIMACVTMIITSASSGPILSSLAAMGALCMWYYRHQIRLFRWLVVIGYVGLDLVMIDPAYFVIARIDLTGSSTGWHRSRLIQSAFQHLSEWWLTGTDYTRHWMPTGVQWSENHTDITNHYLSMGVLGGLLLMVLFIAILAKGFSYVGQALRAMPESPSQSRFIIWALGASLFTHAVTFISVSYFDQSFVFIYLTLASISSVWSVAVKVYDEGIASTQSVRLI